MKLNNLKFVVLAFFLAINVFDAKPCTRVVYTGKDGLIVTGRTMDWKTKMYSNIWVFPRGMERSGEAGENSLKWTSKYGSVITSAFEIASTDGMNEKGLVANLLWLPDSKYEERDENKPGLTIAAWVQYMLDNFATVEEAVAATKGDTFQVVSDMMPDGSRLATLHLSISDAEGDNAIFEYTNGKLEIFHSKDYNVMTNSPTYDQQIAINNYWKGIGGLTFLPGTNRATDRFARASFYAQALPKSDDAKVVVASVFSIVRNVSVPYGISTPDSPEISTTQWRTVSDSKSLRYFFESSLTPNTFWVDLKDFKLSKGSPVMKLKLDNDESYFGNAAKDFKKSEPFKFLGLSDK